jgi:predicted ATPase/DNA-binding CsgD family transcriptional regulator
MPERHHSGIPLLPGPLVGRQAELFTARHLLLATGARLVTLTGPPGVGKTSLALALAADLHGHFADGIRFVDLSTVTDADLVATVMADGLGAGGGRRPLTRLIGYLSERECLLVVDNFEQVIGAAPLVAELLRSCPALAMLVTSRASLRLRWERELSIPTLALPDHASASAPETLARTAAVSLFVERARAVSPGFAVTASNAPAVGELCRRLDGLPLAIELAAARARLLSPEAMLRQLAGSDDDARQGWARPGTRLDVLAGGPRDLPQRQQALGTAIGWSYALLDAAERAMFRRLAVFVGGCTLEAIERVCSEQSAVPTLDAVASLVEKSLVRRELNDPAEPRLRMLETIREYALRELVASGEADLLRARHAAFYLALAEQAAPELEGPDQAVWLDRLDGEHDNLRAAGRWAAERGEAETVLRLGASLWRFWWARANAAEARERVEGMLALASVTPRSLARVKALQGAGVLAHELGDYPRSRALLEESLAVGRQLGDDRAVGSVLDSLGWLAQQCGQPAEARTLLEESLAISQQVGDRRGSAGILARLGYVAFAEGDRPSTRALLDQSLTLARATGDRRIIGEALFNLGLSSHVARDLGEARRFYEESRATLRELGHRPALAQTLHMLAHLLTMTGDVASARPLYHEALVTAREVGNRRRLAFALWTIAPLAVASGEPERAVRLDAAASVAAEAMGAVIACPVRDLYDALLVPAHRELGEERVAAARQAGQALTLQAAVEETLAWLTLDLEARPGVSGNRERASAEPTARHPEPVEPSDGRDSSGAEPAISSPRETAGGEQLTRREREIAALIGQGLTSPEIAERLVISRGTVDAHADHIRTKLELRSRAEIAAWAVRQGLLAK